MPGQWCFHLRCLSRPCFDLRWCIHLRWCFHVPCPPLPCPLKKANDGCAPERGIREPFRLLNAEARRTDFDAFNRGVAKGFRNRFVSRGVDNFSKLEGPGQLPLSPLTVIVYCINYIYVPRNIPYVFASLLIHLNTHTHSRSHTQPTPALVPCRSSHRQRPLFPRSHHRPDRRSQRRP